MKLKISLTTLIMLLASVVYATEPVLYVVKEGDSLSKIAQSYVGNPVYPKLDGSLHKLFEMNSGLTARSVIHPGQTLIIGWQETPTQAQAVTPRKIANVESSPVAEAKTSSDSEGKEIPHTLVTAVGYGMTTLSAVDPNSTTKADLITSHDVKLMAGWRQEWSNHFSTTIFGSLRDVDFQSSTNDTKTLSSTHKTMTGLGLQATHSVADYLQLNYELGYESQLFVHGLSTSTVAVDSAPVPQAKFAVFYKAFEAGKTSLDLEGQVAYLLPTSTDGYSIHAGSLYGLGFSVRRKYGTDSSVRLGLSYQDRSQNTSILNFREKSVFGHLTFELPLFDGGGTK